MTLLAQLIYWIQVMSQSIFWIQIILILDSLLVGAHARGGAQGEQEAGGQDEGDDWVHGAGMKAYDWLLNTQYRMTILDGYSLHLT